jgi:glutamyl-tRNA reductase
MTVATPSIVVVGSNHEYATVDIRERLAFVGETLTDGLRALHQHVGEGFILSTCNRTEIYIAADDPANGHQDVFAFLSDYHHVPMHVLERASYTFSGDEAVEHLFRVASGLDSMVLGEPQILSQIRDALATAREAESVGPTLQRLATDALRIGKRARTETDIARNRLSIAHAALDYAIETTGDLAGKTVLLIGAGKMSTLSAKLLRGRGAGRIIIANRSGHAARSLAEQVGGEAIPMSGIAWALEDADLAIAAVGADHYVVTPEHLRVRRKPLLLVDLSVPRSIDTMCETVADVVVRDVDALESLAEAARFAFASEVAKVEALVQDAVGDFSEWARTRAAAEAIRQVRRHAEAIQDAELEKALRKLAHLSPRDLNIVSALASGITNKLTHAPVTALRSAASLDEMRRLAAAQGVMLPVASEDQEPV